MSLNIARARGMPILARLATTTPTTLGCLAMTRRMSSLANESRLQSKRHDTDAGAAALATGESHAKLMAGFAVPESDTAKPLGREVRPRERRHLPTHRIGGASTADLRAAVHHDDGVSTHAEFHTTAARADPMSTALKESVRKAEEAADQDKEVSTTSVGVEGTHYNDRSGDVANPITELQSSGQWTMMNPIYTEAELNTIEVVGREPVTVGDKLAHGVVKLLRRCFDLATGYVAKEIPPEVLAQKPVPVEELRKNGDILTDKQWLLRILLLESIAGVPGMVGGTLRHLRSLRLLRRDGGWIHTLLEEAENERMHLLTFLTVAQPSIITRALVLGAQGVFYNAFFLTYLLSPKLAHRFVGALEEEAVRTYTHCIDDMEKGLIPEWNDKPAPQIAIDYWRMPEDASLLDVIKAVRADEATHRFVNHSLANLDQKKDFNPFALAEASPELRGTKFGFTREESAEFARQSQIKMFGQPKAQGTEALETEQPVEEAKENNEKKI